MGSGEAPQTVPPVDGYGAPQDAAAIAAGGYAQVAGYGGDAQPPAEGGEAKLAAENPYSGGDAYGYDQQPMNQMYQMNQMMYGGQGGGQGGENMFYAQMGGGGNMGGGNMFNANLMGMGMGGPMGMGMGMGYNPMGGEERKLAEQFGGMGFEDGGKGGGGRGRGGGRGGVGGFDGGGFEGGKGKGKGKGFMHGPMGGYGMDGRGRGGYGKGGYAGGFEDRGKRDEERDRERARNGVRGLRSGFGGMTPMGPPVHTPEVMRLKETINPAEFEIAPKFARFFGTPHESLGTRDLAPFVRGTWHHTGVLA